VFFLAKPRNKRARRSLVGAIFHTTRPQRLRFRSSDPGKVRFFRDNQPLNEVTLTGTWSIVVEALADSGEYQVLVKVRDERNGAVAEARGTFKVHGRDVPPSDTLVVRDFRFFRSEEDAKPVRVAAYRPGDSLWARFVMTGYKMGEKNQFDIEYGLTVLRADGTVAYTEPKAAAQKDQPFYPQRYQPGVLSLNFPKDQPLGEFTIVLTVKDNLGGHTVETRQSFSVE